MATIEELARSWHNIQWKLGPQGEGPLREELFKGGGTLELMLFSVHHPDDPDPTVCVFNWEGGHGEKGTMRLTLQDGKLHATEFTVTIACDVTLTIDESNREALQGRLDASRHSYGNGAGSGNAGTFIADANPPTGGRPPK